MGNQLQETYLPPYSYLPVLSQEQALLRSGLCALGLYLLLTETFVARIWGHRHLNESFVALSWSSFGLCRLSFSHWYCTSVAYRIDPVSLDCPYSPGGSSACPLQEGGSL